MGIVTIIALLIGIANLALLFIVFKKIQSTDQEKIASQEQLNRVSLDMAERFAKSSAETRTALSQGLHEQYSKMQEHLTRAQKELVNLSQVSTQVSELNNLLKLPHLRGSFGETTMESILADFLPADSFEIQKGTEGGSRPDAVVKFPKAKLPIDSKFPREQILPLFESSDPAKIDAARNELSRAIKIQAKLIADKYIRPEDGFMDMALMFLPSETLYFEVIRNPELWQQLSKLKVFPVSPNTLAITLKSIAIAQDYYQMAQNVTEIIADINKAKKHFDNFQSRFEEIGSRLGQAQDAFQKANTNLNRYSGSVTRLTGETAEALAEQQTASKN